MVQIHHPQCPFCHTAVAPGDRKVACDRCMSWQHEACWSEHGRCATCRATTRLARTLGPAAPEPSRLALDPPDPELEAYIRSQTGGVPGLIPTPRPTRAPPWDCPRCKLPLSPGQYEDTHVQSCRQCLGYWLSEQGCAEIATKRDAYFSPEERRTVLRGSLADYDGEIQRDLPCPMCLSTLAPMPFKGLLPYRCAGHGVWLDTGDLKRIQIVAESNMTILSDLLHTLRS